MELFKGVGDVLLSAYEALISSIPPLYQTLIKFLIIALGIIIYSLIVWKFYKSISKKNIIGLNLNKYNKSKHPLFAKLIAGGLFFLEYLLIMPLLIFLWFAIFTILLIFITENLSIDALLIISATTIAAIRMLAYHHEDLAQDVAKIIPFTLLATSLLNPDFFSVERVLGRIKEIPGVFDKILIYLLFIILLEAVLRLIDFLFSLFQLKDEPEEEEDEGEEEEEIEKELEKPAKKKKRR
ncbi:hypothetical protein DRN73_06620 [Candidatus Pacearchaeota archaeon]|nr:MAG: hypothetical protein DRN73_06620 [Candidatus Pacearchaeota archaeon]